MYTFFLVNELNINSPFGAPAYYKETVASTMDEARLLANPVSGTVIAAGEQSAGRGRIGRPWKTGNTESLAFTLILKFGTIEKIPPALTLRTGLAVAQAVEDFLVCILNSTNSPLAGRVLVKWPNDVMLLDKAGHGRKVAGILTEASGENVYIGIGVNIAQKSFPPELAGKACSIAQALLETYNQNDATTELLTEKRFILLEKILLRLHEELNTAAGISLWRNRLEKRLYMKCQKICFVPGLPEEYADKSPLVIEGILHGIGENGEILIVPDGGEILSFVTGELKPQNMAYKYPKLIR